MFSKLYLCICQSCWLTEANEFFFLFGVSHELYKNKCLIYLDLSGSHGVGLHEVQSVHSSGAQNKWPKVAHGARYLGRQEY